MVKSNQVFVLCLLALIITLIPNQSNILAASNDVMGSRSNDVMGSSLFEDYELPNKIQTLVNSTNIIGSWPGITIFSVQNVTEGIFNVLSTHLLFVNNEGQIVKERVVKDRRLLGLLDPQMINDTTVMMTDTYAGYLSFWNLETNAEYTIENINGTLWGHHDVMYNPITDTFVTLGKNYHKAEGNIWMVDTIWEFNWKGELLWEWDMSDWVTNYEHTRCKVSDHKDLGEVFRFELGEVIDYSHSNTIYWDTNTNILYLNSRNIDQVWAIEYPSGKVLWIAGRNGNFTMYDKHGVQKGSLWYHSHAFVPILGEESKFILFDNDLHNKTNPDNKLSRMVEVVIDTETWIMNETWSWKAHRSYYSPIWGDADRLPNGNRLGCFGSRTFRWDGLPPFPKGGAALVEVNEASDIVWQLTFPKGYGIYRAHRFQPSLNLNSPEDINGYLSENGGRAIIWTGKSVFKAYYEITKDGELLEKNTWTTAKIFYELPSDLEVGTHSYTLTVFDHAGQSVSDTVKVTIKTHTTITATATTTITVSEILAFPASVSGVLVLGLATIGLIEMLLRRKR